MRYYDVEVTPGQLVRLSDLGRQRCPKLKLKSDTGIVLSMSGISAVRVLFHGRKQPVTLHLSYIEMQSGVRGSGPAPQTGQHRPET